MVKEQIIAAITAKRAHVGVVGLGYVGLPLLAEFAGSGFQATGLEVDENKAEQIIAAITAKRAHVGVVGLGYVGLPLLAEFAGSGFQATGFEVDENKAAQINAGESYIGDVNSSIIKEHVEGKRLRATTDFDHLKDCDAVIICVPTPLRKTKEPDVSYILAAAEEIKKRLHRG